MASRCSQGVRGLQFVLPLDAFAATVAVADVDIELPVTRLPRDVCLVLRTDSVGGQLVTSTVRAGFRQRHVVVLGNIASSLLSVLIARLLSVQSPSSSGTELLARTSRLIQ